MDSRPDPVDDGATIIEDSFSGEDACCSISKSNDDTWVNIINLPLKVLGASKQLSELRLATIGRTTSAGVSDEAICSRDSSS